MKDYKGDTALPADAVTFPKMFKQAGGDPICPIAGTRELPSKFHAQDAFRFVFSARADGSARNRSRAGVSPLAPGPIWPAL